ncbi:MAG: NAD(P)/FAD-dependent oxidoreductase [Vicinamibacterales bacterium]
MHTDADADVIIVGAGPAGLSAALILARACRRVIVFDHDRPRNAATRELHGFLTRDGTPPSAFREYGRAELAKYPGVTIQPHEVLDAARLDTGLFEVELADTRRFTSRKLLLATGVVDLLPDVPGLSELYGHSVFHCPYCDGWELRDAGLAAYGRGKRGHGLSLELLGWSKDVVLCTDGDSELDSKERARLTRNGIAIHEARIARLEGCGGVLERVVFADGSSLPRRALFFSNGQSQCSRLAERLGCEFNDKGTVRTGPYESTHMPGLYVAGDASRAVQWVVVAAAEGAEAAYAINQDLLKHSVR